MYGELITTISHMKGKLDECDIFLPNIFEDDKAAKKDVFFCTVIKVLQKASKEKKCILIKNEISKLIRNLKKEKRQCQIHEDSEIMMPTFLEGLLQYLKMMYRKSSS
ncbi:hypothetical protein AOXY_G20148 [Acipenser oxyrinchus oxyrinchus]|uniref:Uncharacterized protein n=1 Tax=Acipenser oxyrinchus oxyrinchus TaxID=40147 RepID=A0AAD8D114_ACIOX|nr:hypothetical protein AOXY_G20148 [Acipenser oxyrinchus oxyrinchus]